MRPNIILNLITFACFCLFASPSVSAQCVTCNPAQGGGWECVSAIKGGKSCSTLGTNCILTGPCGADEERASPQSMAVGGNILKQEKLQFDPNALRQIAAANPYFAIALASFKGGLRYADAKIYVPPVKVNTEDFEWWLKPDDESANFFSKYIKKSKRAFQNNLSPLVFDLNVEISADRSLATLHLKMIEGPRAKPTRSILVMTFEHLENATSDSGPQSNPAQKNSWGLLRWQID